MSDLYEDFEPKMAIINVVLIIKASKYNIYEDFEPKMAIINVVLVIKASKYNIYDEFGAKNVDHKRCFINKNVKI